MPTFAFPTNIDNTMVSAHRRCARSFWWRHMRWLQRNETSIHLISGGAYAKGLEVVRKCYFDGGLSFEESLARGAVALIREYGYVEPHPKHSNKALPVILGALAYYFEKWPINRNMLPYRPSEGGKSCIEWNFAVPVPGVKNPTTGGPILYCGRFDQIGIFEDQMLLGEDDKTSGQLGQQWFDRWRLSSQILGYCWGAREHGMNLAGFLVRGVGLLKTNYSDAETTVMVNPWQIDRFVEQLVIRVGKMIEDFNLNRYEMDLGSTCSSYGGCDFLPLCESPEPESWIPVNYVEREWNPLASRD